MGKSSNRPASILKQRISLVGDAKCAKVSVGPSSLRAGPTLLRQLATEERPVTMSQLSMAVTSKVEITKSDVNAIINEVVPRMVSWSMVFPSNLTDITERGWEI